MKPSDAPGVRGVEYDHQNYAPGDQDEEGLNEKSSPIREQRKHRQAHKRVDCVSVQWLRSRRSNEGIHHLGVRFRHSCLRREARSGCGRQTISVCCAKGVATQRLQQPALSSGILRFLSVTLLVNAARTAKSNRSGRLLSCPKNRMRVEFCGFRASSAENEYPPMQQLITLVR
jgi:hypothetical protein